MSEQMRVVNRRGVWETYRVASLEAVSLHSTVRVELNADAWGVHGSKHVLDFADQSFILSENLTRQ